MKSPRSIERFLIECLIALQAEAADEQLKAQCAEMLELYLEDSHSDIAELPYADGPVLWAQ